MLGKPIVFVDVETTGLSAHDGYVVEVGAIRYERGEITKHFQTLVDPGVTLSPFITQITGISDTTLKGAPQFRDIMDELYEMLNGTVFAAHNVGFDWGFLGTEFRRYGQTLRSQRFCTARLSKALFPQFKSHSLDSIIARQGYQVANRHRAYDDAYVLYQFFRDMEQAKPIELSRAYTKLLIN